MLLIYKKINYFNIIDNNKLHYIIVNYYFNGATGGTWTHTLFPAEDFKSSVSAYSTTIAYMLAYAPFKSASLPVTSKTREIPM